MRSTAILLLAIAAVPATAQASVLYEVKAEAYATGSQNVSSIDHPTNGTVATASASNSGTVQYSNGSTYTYGGSATASASLATGNLTAYAQSTGAPQVTYPGGGGDGPVSGYGGGLATLQDTFTLVAPSGWTGSTAPVELDFALHGTLTGNAFIDYITNVYAGTALLGSIRYNITPPYGLSEPLFNTVELPSSDPNTILFRMTFNAPLNQALTLYSSLYAQASSGDSTSDYSHTARMSLVLPDGFTYTSASGVFLTASDAAPGSVPELSTWAMMLVGFGGIGFAMRRQRRDLQTSLEIA